MTSAIPGAIWVVTLSEDDDVLGRLGDARDVADHLDLRVSVLAIGWVESSEASLASRWIEHGADHVHLVCSDRSGMETSLSAAASLWRDCRPRLVLASADRVGRAWSARMAARCGWRLISPALIVRARSGRLTATALDVAGRRARSIELVDDSPTIVALRPGVALALPSDPARTGTVTNAVALQCPETTRRIESLPADPAVADIRHLSRLVAGGRGVGGREGFDRLRRVAVRLGAGVAASRMAVDLGWIEYERQVGQTGKTVQPDLYLACGISGASHHWDGMSQSRHIIAINSDPQAPLMSMAHLGLVGDLHAVLEEFENRLAKK